MQNRIKELIYEDLRSNIWEVSAQAGIGSNTLYALKKDRQRLPTMGTCVKLAEAFNLKITDIIED